MKLGSGCTLVSAEGACQKRGTSMFHFPAKMVLTGGGARPPIRRMPYKACPYRSNPIIRTMEVASSDGVGSGGLSVVEDP